VTSAGNVATVTALRPGLFSAARPAWIERLDELHLLTPARIVAIVAVGWLLTILVRRIVSRFVGRLLGAAGRRGDERSNPRSRSLSGVLRSAALAVIWVVTVIAVVGELGVNVGGVLVTATVIGGALAFGAQALVRDVIAGVFVLSEDQYAVGDVIDVGPIGGGADRITGSVERLTLRSTRLRDGEGRVWHVPNGAILRVANLSQESLAILDLTVSRSADLATVRAEGGRLGLVLEAHPVAGVWCVGDVSEIGLQEVRDDRLVVRFAVSVAPGRQSDVERIWRELVLQAERTGKLDRPD